MRELKKGDLVKIIRNCTINGSIGVVIEYRHYQPNREWNRVWKVYFTSISQTLWVDPVEVKRISE